MKKSSLLSEHKIGLMAKPLSIGELRKAITLLQIELETKMTLENEILEILRELSLEGEKVLEITSKYGKKTK
jgi:hypothetical protein